MEAYEAEDLRDLMRRLDLLVEGARPVPLLKDQITLDRMSVYAVLDSIRASLPEAIKTVRWYRQRRADEGDPPLGSNDPMSLDSFSDIDAVDDLIHSSPPVPLTDRVRVKRNRLEPLLDRMRGVLVPLGQELADFKSVYPAG